MEQTPLLTAASATPAPPPLKETLAKFFWELIIPTPPPPGSRCDCAECQTTRANGQIPHCQCSTCRLRRTVASYGF